MFMDDSGIDSGDRLESLLIDELGTFTEGHHVKDTTVSAGKASVDSDAESDIFSKLHDFDVVFEDPHEKLQDPARAAAAVAAAPVPDGAYFPAGRREHPAGRKVLVSDNSTDSFTSSSATSNGGGTPMAAPGTGSVDDGSLVRDHNGTAQLSTCKILQRKLELKVERAKRNYKQMYHDNQESVEREPKISSLIPISRLPIPACRDSHQLVDVNTGFNSDDDLENVSFFPRARKTSGTQARQELSDTFSIQEMTIESDNDDLDFEQCRKLSDSKGYRKILNRSGSGGSAGGGPDDYLDNDTLDEDDDSQNLELLPPKGGYALKERLRRLFCCCRKDDFL
ncbi:uncharacterized protein LOC131286250 [Anopheles ziemanni]|uniref:uncharacterized protein LOC131259505 n=1 Tax=Anopheles coustani TaxID=139045 RepID=UPI002657F103|nr:uncharacterized protein LOC131259505 [Anopheles coustani]XP_058171164.1 uncharacterized protein LOC131286250 [Anopheles ziemanni]